MTEACNHGQYGWCLQCSERKDRQERDTRIWVTRTELEEMRQRALDGHVTDDDKRIAAALWMTRALDAEKERDRLQAELADAQDPAKLEAYVNRCLETQSNLFGEKIDALERQLFAARQAAFSEGIPSGEFERELKDQTAFNSAFADKLNQFGTVDRLVEEYSQMKIKCRNLEAQVDRLKTMSTVEMMCENDNVHAHVTEWEKRCLDAEQQLKAALFLIIDEIRWLRSTDGSGRSHTSLHRANELEDLFKDIQAGDSGPRGKDTAPEAHPSET